jgi:hypothetical protein
MNTTPNTTPDTTPPPVAPPATVTDAVRPWYRHPAAIAVGATAGAILVLGGSVAIALELTDDLWSPEYRSSSSLVTPVVPAAPTNGTAEARELPADSSAPSESPSTATLEGAIVAAVSAAGGAGATSVATAGGRFEVDVLLPDGREIDVYVGADGRAVIDSVPYANPSGDPAIEVARVPAIVEAALAAVESFAGSSATIYELSTTSEPGRAFDITALLPNGAAVYVELSSDLAVVEIDLD